MVGGSFIGSILFLHIVILFEGFKKLLLTQLIFLDTGLFFLALMNEIITWGGENSVKLRILKLAKKQVFSCEKRSEYGKALAVIPIIYSLLYIVKVWRLIEVAKYRSGLKSSLIANDEFELMVVNLISVISVVSFLAVLYFYKKAKAKKENGREYIFLWIIVILDLLYGIENNIKYIFAERLWEKVEILNLLEWGGKFLLTSVSIVAIIYSIYLFYRCWKHIKQEYMTVIIFVGIIILNLFLIMNGLFSEIDFPYFIRGMHLSRFGSYLIIWYISSQRWYVREREPKLNEV